MATEMERKSSQLSRRPLPRKSSAGMWFARDGLLAGLIGLIY